MCSKNVLPRPKGVSLISSSGMCFSYAKPTSRTNIRLSSLPRVAKILAEAPVFLPGAKGCNPFGILESWGDAVCCVGNLLCYAGNALCFAALRIAANSGLA